MVPTDSTAAEALSVDADGILQLGSQRLQVEVKERLAANFFTEANRGRIVEEFSAFYRGFAARLAGWLIWQGASEADAKDVVQETMHKAYQRWATIDTPEAWARVTASRAYAERLGKVDAMPVDDIAEHTPETAAGCELTAADAKQDIRMALQQMPARQRQMLAWSFEGYTPAEIAAQLRMTPEAVRSSLYKARKRLEELLQVRDEGDQNEGASVNDRNMDTPDRLGAAARAELDTIQSRLEATWDIEAGLREILVEEHYQRFIGEQSGVLDVEAGLADVLARDGQHPDPEPVEVDTQRLHV